MRYEITIMKTRYLIQRRLVNQIAQKIYNDNLILTEGGFIFTQRVEESTLFEDLRVADAFKELLEAFNYEKEKSGYGMKNYKLTFTIREVHIE